MGVEPMTDAPKSAHELEKELRGIAAKANDCSIWRPIHTYRTTGGLRRQLDAMRDDLDRVLGSLEAEMNAQFSGQSFAAGAVTSGSVGTALMHYLRLQQARSDASATLDRQGAFSLAAFGLYVAVLGLVVSIIALILALRPFSGVR